MVVQPSSINLQQPALIKARKGLYLHFKRMLDLSLALALVILLSPLFLTIAILVKLDSPGPVLFKQTRIGRNNRCRERRDRPVQLLNQRDRRANHDRRDSDESGKLFTFYKFRTMYQNADSEVHRQFVQSFIKNEIPDCHISDASSPAFKITRDPRVSRVGRILRKTSLDELPQLFNVIKGDMSLVGPRPPLPYEVHEYQEWHKVRLLATPGITGWWQVQGRSRVTFNEMVRMDAYYIDHISLALDLKIMLLTPWAMFSGNGAM